MQIFQTIEHNHHTSSDDIELQRDFFYVHFSNPSNTPPIGSKFTEL